MKRTLFLFASILILQKTFAQQLQDNYWFFGYDNNFGWGRLDAYYCIAINNLNLIDKQVAGLQTYATKDYITSGTDNEMMPTSNVTLTAGKAITLNPGFKTDINCVFSASIDAAGTCGTIGGGPFRSSKPIDNSVTILGTSNQNASISVRPNPAQFDVLISSKNDEILMDRITVKNAIGQQISDINTGAAHSYLMDITNYNPGIYCIVINTNNGVVIKKIIKK